MARGGREGERVWLGEDVRGERAWLGEDVRGRGCG